MENTELQNTITADSLSSSGMDIIIVSTSNQQHEDYWHKRLKQLKGVICKKDAFVIAINEDWPGGAGSGLGTLYAYYKAQEKAKFMYHTDLYEMQKKGASVAIYHTAGQGRRLYPLTASELNDKSAVKLPGNIEKGQLTILEAVIAQTNQLGDRRKGRLSVFWGDQIFIPSKHYNEKGDHHIELLSKNNDIRTESDWNKVGLSSYGIVSIDNDRRVKLVEKVDYETFDNLVSKKMLSIERGLATSLGSFSLSPQMTFALLREFETELEDRRGKLDSDSHFWMPLTLDLMTYIDLMSKKGITHNQACEQFRRMENFKTKFFRLHSNKNFFNVVDIGTRSYWWDYGSVKSYYQNILKLASPGQESEAMKLFYKINPREQFENANRVIKDPGSCLINCNIRSGKITNSVLIGVNAKSLEATNCVIINSNLSTIQANNSLFYNIEEERDIKFSKGTIRADVSLPKSKKKLILYTHQGRDGEKDWDVRLPQNPCSFEQAYQTIHSEI